MYMEEIFQELLLSLGISVAVFCMIMKLKPYGIEDGGEFKKSEEQELNFGLGKNSGVWNFAEFLKKLSIDKDEGLELQDLSIEKEFVGVGGDESSCLSHGNSNVIDDVKVVSEITDDVEVFETLIRRDRVSCYEIEECSQNSEEENTLRLKEVSRISGICEEHRGEKEEEEMFDDWEGVERTELEKLFGAAMVFVNSKRNAGLIDRDMKIRLYGLHKIVIEGPCRGSQPMALNVSARAKWVSWKRLGNMSRELAMEQYLLTLSERVPDWMRSNLQGSC